MSRPHTVTVKKQKAQVSKKKPKIPAKKKVVQATKPKEEVAKVQQLKSESISAPVGKDASAPIRIGIRAHDDCRVQVKIDGKTIFQNVLVNGRLESWQAKEKIELALGSAGSIELEVNGNRIPSLGRKGQVLKNILINRDGLRVSK